jgi:hypothetical protein
MCCGNKIVIVTIGTGEKYNVECEACRAGYLGARGFIEEYEQTPRADRFEIAKIIEWRDGKWRVESTTNQIEDFTNLYATEEEALAKATQNAEQLIEQNMANRRKKKYGKVSSWTIQYHLKQIKQFERDIKWHREKINQKQKTEE